jgi:hypothetical protein
LAISASGLRCLATIPVKIGSARSCKFRIGKLDQSFHVSRHSKREALIEAVKQLFVVRLKKAGNPFPLARPSATGQEHQIRERLV